VRGAAIVLAVWAALLGVLTAIQVIFPTHLVSGALLGGAAAATLVVGGLVFLGRRRAPEFDPDAERPVTELSLASGFTGLGVALLALSARFGVFLTAIAGGMIALGIGGIVRELRAERRLRR
jgi:hypothetical protein